MAKPRKCPICTDGIIKNWKAKTCWLCYLKTKPLPSGTFKKGQNVRDKHPRWSGGKWCWAKKFVISRDGGVCQICRLDEKEIMDVAHKRGFENGGVDRRYTTHNPDHLITLCPNCHRRYDLGIVNLR